MGKRGAVGPQAKRTKGVAAAVDAGSFPAPDYLSPTALEYWTATVAAFPVGHFTDSDRVLLEQYCEAAATHRNAGLIIQKEGRKYKDDKGIWRRNLAVDDAHHVITGAVASTATPESSWTCIRTVGFPRK